ncbi:MAG: DUF4365 domain-containing protein [Sphingobacteriales bacterium]|nr:MAG: DUF4365 domain-containing protein [Sphingobacteriales bacterium]
MSNSIPSDRYAAYRRFAVDVYTVCQHSRKPMLAAWRNCLTEAVLIAGWVALEASASRKVLQVLASVMQALWAIANVCRLMRLNFYIRWAENQTAFMITDDQVKEQLSISYVNAIAAMCNFGCELTRVDIDSVDATITCNGNLATDSTIRSPFLKVQLKATENLQPNSSSNYPFFLKKKNYDDLRARTLSPRLLIVLNLPTGKTNWLTHSVNDLIIRNCAYWLNLYGLPDVTNTSGATVYIPTVNHFSPSVLQDLMLKVSREQSL